MSSAVIIIVVMSPCTMRFRTCTSLVLLTLSPLTFADSIWLKNGDHFTGTIKLLDSKKLLIETDYGGTLSIDWEKVKTLQIDKPSTVLHSDSEAGFLGQSIKPSDDSKVSIQTPHGEKIFPLADIKSIVPIKAIVGDFSWEGNVDLSLDNTQSSSAKTEDYNIDFKVQARHSVWRHNATGSYSRYESDDSVSTNNYSLEYALDRFLGEKLFWQGRVEYKRDWVEVLASQRTTGTGPGYQFWDNELGAFSLTGLLNHNQFDFSDGGTKTFVSANLKWDYSRNLDGQKIQLFTSGEIGRPFAGVADFTLDGELGVRYKLTDWASLNIKASKALINDAPSDANQTQYTIGVGVKW